MKAFHGTLVGLKQLHMKHIVHQDIKPSNILIFNQNYSKISDLGSATQFENKSNWEKDNHSGDIRYAPIELLYRYYSSDWETRRFGADLFMMGGLLVYMLTGANFLNLILLKMPESHYPLKFDGKFEEIKPLLMNAYFESLTELKPLVPTIIADKIIGILAELLHPDPEERGNPVSVRNVHKQFTLQRYISKLDLIYRTSLYQKL